MQFNCIKMSQYFPKSFRTFGGNINVKVDLSNYATKTDLKNSKFALKTIRLATEQAKLNSASRWERVSLNGWQ